MKLLMFLASAFMLTLAGCGKEDKGCTNVKPADEEAQILAYAAANGITAVKHSSGMYYQVVTQGSGVVPNVNSTVTVNYTGKFLNGTLFDKSAAPVSFKLNQVIEGWIVGIPLINKGGSIKMIIPSSMAYGCNGARTIPPNSVLYFEVDLIDVQ
ncbi:MAG: FKBP-type peptidyl-prolyl cis-trans isomerase [Chitinophagaceae bacterium]|nr:FKBP-type peptidyl-prolyl cis-trans isomerase [Chitinophagaceae bacterium]